MHVIGKRFWNLMAVRLIALYYKLLKFALVMLLFLRFTFNYFSQLFYLRLALPKPDSITRTSTYYVQTMLVYEILQISLFLIRLFKSFPRNIFLPMKTRLFCI